jgi:hypothetical protein
VKLAFTVSDFGAAVNIGGEIERSTYVIEVPDELIPAKVKWAKNEMDKCPPGKSSWLAITITEVKEVPRE